MAGVKTGETGVVVTGVVTCVGGVTGVVVTAGGFELLVVTTGGVTGGTTGVLPESLRKLKRF